MNSDDLETGTVSPMHSAYLSPVPVPVSEIAAKLKGAAASGPAINVDERGRASISLRPSCMMRLFYLPFPFLCMGCCLSSSADLDFDDRTSTVSIARWPGDCFCCMSATTVVAYAHVANVVARSTNMRINKQSAYKIAIALRDGQVINLGSPDVLGSISGDLLALHRFFFGRGVAAKTYRAPEPHSLVLAV